jgi:Polyketide cyclase / dehydrase and lipid transport
VVSASQIVRASPDRIFARIADPSRQPEWDGNDNLAHAAPGQRVRAVGEIFTMTLRIGAIRENHVVEFEEGRIIAWMPAEPGRPPVGHLWRWEVQAVDAERSLVTHTYDWTELTDETRLPRARATTSERLASSLARLAVLLEYESEVAEGP